MRFRYIGPHERPDGTVTLSSARQKYGYKRVGPVVCVIRHDGTPPAGYQLACDVSRRDIIEVPEYDTILQLAFRHARSIRRAAPMFEEIR